MSIENTSVCRPLTLRRAFGVMLLAALGLAYFADPGTAVKGRLEIPGGVFKSPQSREPWAREFWSAADFVAFDPAHAEVLEQLGVDFARDKVVVVNVVDAGMSFGSGPDWKRLPLPPSRLGGRLIFQRWDASTPRRTLRIPYAANHLSGSATLAIYVTRPDTREFFVVPRHASLIIAGPFWIDTLVVLVLSSSAAGLLLSPAMWLRPLAGWQVYLPYAWAAGFQGIVLVATGPTGESYRHDLQNALLPLALLLLVALVGAVNARRLPALAPFIAGAILMANVGFWVVEHGRSWS